MTVRIAPAGRLLMVGISGPDLDPGTAARLRALRPAGVILFARNLESPPQTARLIAALRRGLDEPPVLALDQEGGRVSRLESWIGPTPPASVLASAGPAAVRRFAQATGRALRSLGFGLDFAPVVDLCPPDVPNGIGDRSFGTDPERVTELAGAFLDGLEAGGVAGCLKHFPGLGPTRVDSHLTLPTAERTREELERLDFVPFRRLGCRSACVMVGHGHYPALDPEPSLPATLSGPIVSGVLRSRLGYSGLVVTDDMEMGAVAALDEDGSGAVRAVAAGCDLLLYCRDLDRAEAAAAALAARADRDAAFARRLDEARQAIETFAACWAAPVEAAGGWEQARSELIAASGVG